MYSDSTINVLNGGAIANDVLEGVAYKAFNLANDRVGIQSGGVNIGNAQTLNFVGTGNTFAVNGSTIDVSISSGAASIMTIGVRVGTAVTLLSHQQTQLVLLEDLAQSMSLSK